MAKKKNKNAGKKLLFKKVSSSPTLAISMGAHSDIH